MAQEQKVNGKMSSSQCLLLAHDFLKEKVNCDGGKF